MKRLFPILTVLTALLLAYGTYQALVVAPTERTMGDVQRIFYYHVPSAWAGFCVFCTIVLVTGPIWARPVWGIWWTWDVRLTSTLVLWLIYVSYLVLRRFSDSAQTPVLAAVLAIFGALDVPLVYFSIWFFRTQHPQPVIGGGGSIDPRMLKVFLLNLFTFSCFGAMLCWWRYRLELLQREVDEAEALESLLEPEESRLTKPKVAAGGSR